MSHEGKILCVNVNGEKGTRALAVASVVSLMREERPDIVFLQDLTW